jgi:hypothetical protein
MITISIWRVVPIFRKNLIRKSLPAVPVANMPWETSDLREPWCMADLGSCQPQMFAKRLGHGLLF